MGGRCREGEYFDLVVQQCVWCNIMCQRSDRDASCTKYCVSAKCKELSGHYYDRLLMKCVNCAKICGRHPVECSQHCLSPSLPPAQPPPSTTITPQVEVALRTPTTRVRFVPDSTILIHSLLAVCVALLLSSLCVAFAVFLKKTRARTKTSGPGPAATKQAQEGAVKLGQEVGLPGWSTKGFQTDSNIFHPTEPAGDSSPTETCVCVHCFPDLRAPDQGEERLLGPPFSFYQQAVLQRAKPQEGQPLWTQEVQAVAVG
ncbi:tumor necrosis factor receptor superfamily member 13B [Centroberyx affinis]|uniref:tumor necrosis factor receptor superfamily member 13B n=1 Tax=Centroberyx affinis TaxID=166261 RepID=UPI003A5BEE4E